ncbi:MAG TPA: DUF3395 domain-containing protein [Methylomirabilota bacterium]|nr:DUF3395 domain-containing protein [Methylomirabilota bacterium]
MRVIKSFRLSLKFFIVVFAFFFGMPFFATRAGAQDEGWRIIRADYGFRDHRTDVSDLLRDLVGRGGVNGRVAVNNQTMGGDPAVGRDKVLHIHARNRRGEERDFEFREGSFVDVAMFAVPSDDWGERGERADRGPGPGEREGGLFIIRGFYGVQGRTVNVTDALRSMVRGGMLSLNVNNYNLGGDPAPGADKILIVIYRFQGQEQATAVREGNRLTIP